MASKKRNKRRGRVSVPPEPPRADGGQARGASSAGSTPAAEPLDFDEPAQPKKRTRAQKEDRVHLDAARKIMLKAKGYADRPSRRGHIERLLCRNFQQRPAIKNTAEYDRNFERTFGKKRPKVEYGQRDGYVVRPYRGSVLPEDLDLGSYTHDDPNSDEVIG